jgi:hypothetical protein
MGDVDSSEYESTDDENTDILSKAQIQILQLVVEKDDPHIDKYFTTTSTSAKISDEGRAFVRGYIMGLEENNWEKMETIGYSAAAGVGAVGMGTFLSRYLSRKNKTYTTSEKINELSKNISKCGASFDKNEYDKKGDSYVVKQIMKIV